MPETIVASIGPMAQVRRPWNDSSALTIATPSPLTPPRYSPMIAPRTAAGADKAKPPPALGKAARKRNPHQLCQSALRRSLAPRPMTLRQLLRGPVIHLIRLTKNTDSAAMDTLAASGLIKMRINGPMATLGTQ